MITLRDSLSKKLTAMNMAVSAAALVLAGAAIFIYDLHTFRINLARSVSVQAQIVGSNSVSPLIFNDPRSAENTMSALRAAPHVTYAGIYDLEGHFFAGYWRDGAIHGFPLPPIPPGELEAHWYKNSRLELVQVIIFGGKPVGIVYIQSDLGALTDRQKSYATILLVILGASLIAALILSRISQRIISRPVMKLAETARTVSREKNYAVRAAPTGTADEVAVLIDAFNDMLTAIQERDSDLQEREEQFRTLADSIPQMAWMAEANGALFWYNQRWYQYTGTTSEQMVGWGWQSIHDPATLPRVLEKWRASINTGKPFEMVFPLRGADGGYREFLTLALPVRDAHGKIARWFGSNTDITEQLRSEEALRRSEKLAATGRLAASIAHEINNPLEAVTNLVYLARKQPSNIQKYLAMADQELDRIAQITKNTLGFYRDTSSPSIVNISVALEEVVSLYARKLQFKKITIRHDYGNNMEILGYPGEIRQIFANLVANAIEATEEKGSIAIKVSRVSVWSDHARKAVRVSVMDSGSGIPPEQMARIFEPFYTTKKDVGTGLGLWLTQNLIKKHRGLIRVRSSIRPERRWTVFSVILPIWDDAGN
jgi:PAS domain S-box-containing protein